MGGGGRWAGVVAGIVAIVLTIVGFVGPWWNLKVTGNILGNTFESNGDFRLFGITATTTSGQVSFRNETDYGEDPNVRNVFLVGAAISGAAIAAGVAFVAAAAMAARSASRRRGAAAAGVVAFALGLVSVLYVMAALPAALNQDSQGEAGAPEITGFWGTDSSSIGGFTLTVNWAAGWAWYIVLVGAIVFLIGGVLALRTQATAAPMMPPPSMEMPPESP